MRLPLLQCGMPSFGLLVSQAQQEVAVRLSA